MNETGFIIALITLLYGGFVIALLLSIVAMTPLLKNVPNRWAFIISGLIPMAVLLYMGFGDLLVRGRDAKVILALSPALAAFVFAFIALVASGSSKSMDRKKKVIAVVLAILLLASVSWASILLWMMTDRNFMGAGC
jgi:hypothetical protein